MAFTREQKKEAVTDLKSVIKDATSLVFVNFHGLPMTFTNELRNTIRGRGAAYRVVKKSLLRRALAESQVKGEMPDLEGEIAIAYGDDPIVPANAVAEIAKVHKDQLSITGGIYEGAYATREFMEEIASIPPMPVLRGMFVNVINSPIQGLAVALNAIAEKKTY